VTSRAIDDLYADSDPARAAAFLAWPGLAHLKYSFALMLANGLWFLIVFAGADFVTGRREARMHIDLPGELAIPLVPWTTAVYVSLYLLMLAGPFVLRTRKEFRAAIATLAFTIGIAGICFLLVPAELAFPPAQTSELGLWAPLFGFADDLNLTYNLLPSLHVALAVVCVAAFSTRAERTARGLLWTWAGAVALSTLLTHQHHVLDVLTGWGLALICFRQVYHRLVEPRRAS